jgi:hypothetical protein
MVPGNLEAIYENTIFPYLRQKKDVARLQTAWTRRIQQEAAQVATQDSEFVTKNYREVVLPALEWSQARDLYEAGSLAAATKMLSVIQQNQAHKSAPQWIKDLRSLLTGGSPGAATAAIPAKAADTTETAPPEAPDSEPAAAPATPPAPKPRGPVPTFPPNLNR